MHKENIHDTIEHVQDEADNLKHFVKDVSNETINRVLSESVNIKTNTIQLQRMKFYRFDGTIHKYLKYKEDFHTHIKPLCGSSQTDR